MDLQQVKEDFREGRLDAEQLLDVIDALAKINQRSHAQLQTANKRIEELESRIEELEKDKAREKLDEAYSMKAEEKRQQKRRKKRKQKKKPLRSGRRTTAEKLELAQREEDVFPEGIDPAQCKFSHSRPVWRLEDGRAVLVAYHVYRVGNQYGRIPFTLGRSEFGLEFVIAIGHMVYVMGISFDKVCALLQFFQGLPITKSQANALMNRLARDWEGEFETLCTLLAHAAVVHADETGWSIKSVWAFLSDQVSVCLFGVPKSGATLAAVLDKETFLGVLVSDDAAVYQNFSKAQKCWAHLLRKAIKLTLQDPENETYRTFADALLGLYGKACRIQRDKRYTAATREQKVTELEHELRGLCAARWLDETPTPDEVENSCRCLVNELMRLLLAKELFTFVTEAGVAGTNNEVERELRPMSQARDTGRTNKKPSGCRRQSILYSVLASLRKQLPQYTLETVVSEVQRWWTQGRSCFRELADSLGLPPPETSVLDKVLPLDSS